MASPPHVRGSLPTPIPEISFQLLPEYDPISPVATEAEIVLLRAPGLPLEYYNVPESAAAHFSTCLQTQLKRKLERPFPSAITRTDVPSDVQRKCAELCNKFPAVARQIGGIESWYDLYNYFDGLELWVEGPDFCYFVIHRLGEMNREIKMECSAHIATFAQGWCQANAIRLLSVAVDVDVLGLIGQDECRAQEFNLMHEWEIDILRKELNRFRDLLIRDCRRPHPYVPTAPRRPSYSSPPRSQGYSSRSRRPSQVNRSEDMPTALPTQAFQDYTGYRRTDAPSMPGPQGFQGYNNFMHNQGSLRGPFKEQRINRDRAFSNSSNRGGRYQTPRNSPARNSPVYIHSSMRATSAEYNSSFRPNSQDGPRNFSGPRYFNNDLQNSSFHNRRTVSDFTTNRRSSNFSNDSRPYTQHSRVSSNGTQIVTATYIPDVGQSNNDIYDTFGASNAVLQEELDIQGFPYSIKPNGAVTIFYISRPKNIRENTHDIHVTNVPLSMFFDHSLHKLMSGAGEVDNITHLRGIYGQAFVKFCKEEAVHKAIEMFVPRPIATLGP